MLCDDEAAAAGRFAKERNLFPDFLSLFAEKNKDGTKDLRLKGNELEYRIKRRIKDKDMLLISTYLQDHPNIVKLNLTYNPITDDGFKTFVDIYLMQPNNLSSLILIGCNLSGNSLRYLLEAVDYLKLQNLRLTGINLEDRNSGTYLNKLILKVPTLENLDVGDTGLTLNTAVEVFAALRESDGQHVKTLDISNILPTSMYHQSQLPLIAGHIGEMMKLNTSLTEIHVQKCGFDGHDIELMLIGLKENKTLLLLDVGNNRFSNFGAELIAAWLATKPNLIGLNVTGSSIGYIGAKALSRALPSSMIRLLDISNNKITDMGIAEILLSGKKQQRIRLLYVFGNEIGPESLAIMERQLNAGIYDKNAVDFRVYSVDGTLHAAKVDADTFKSQYYAQLTPEDVRELRIRRNRVESRFCSKHAKVRFSHLEEVPCDKCRESDVTDDCDSSDKKYRDIYTFYNNI